MSDAENKGERIALLNNTTPTTKLDTLVASGVDGNTTSSSNQFDTGVSNLGALFLGQGLSGIGPYAVSAGIFLDIGDGNKYAITNAVGSVVTCKTTSFQPGENDDGFYATTTLPEPAHQRDLRARCRMPGGAALLLPDGTPDKEQHRAHDAADGAGLRQPPRLEHLPGQDGSHALGRRADHRGLLHVGGHRRHDRAAAPAAVVHELPDDGLHPRHRLERHVR